MGIATVSGGSGGHELLKGLKTYYPDEICAIVAMADSEGSSGRLRSVSGILPPGDVRQALVALADAESLMAELFKHRFGKEYGEELNGHSFGNLFIAAMAGVTGNLEKAILESAKILGVRGRVLPVTKDNTHLYAKLRNGRVLKTEGIIDRGYDRKIGDRPPIVDVWLDPPARIYKESKKALRESNPVIIAPGSLYTTTAQLLLVDGVSEALGDRILIYPLNLVGEPGQTGSFKGAPDYTAADYIATIRKLIGRAPDYVLVNTNFPHSEKIQKRYEREGRKPVEYNEREKERIHDELGVPHVIEGDFVSAGGLARSLYRHDSDKLARAIWDVDNSRGTVH